MGKKLTLLIPMAISAIVLALPAAAGGQEVHVEGFSLMSGGGAGANLSISGEPTITCNSSEVVGNFDSGSTTTGNLEIDLTTCHTAVFGFTSSCKTANTASNGTIRIGGTFHLITVSFGLPGFLWTPFLSSVTCAGISTLNFSGNVIGTVTSPACGSVSNQMTVSFGALGSTQEHTLYTGGSYDLTARTGSGELKTAALGASWTVSSATSGFLNCT